MADKLTKNKLKEVVVNAEALVERAHGCRDAEFCGPVTAAIITEALRNPDVMRALLED